MENSLRECIIKSQAKVPIYDSASLLKKKKMGSLKGNSLCQVCCVSAGKISLKSPE